ncbi:MAG: biotin/lipoyl-binding protein [Candidatus Omnitrophica bacterium]|nr:biotin/lipoyl-binding protein [Candidatus Omnitrophota bacterium]
MAEVKLPDLAEGVDKAVVSFWHKEIGEDISKGDDLLEMLTDKATFNVPSPISGKITNILSEEGQEVQVGEVIATIEEA